jgi:hypothetical protein
MNYADHYYSLGETVRQTVKEAQDILWRLGLCIYYQNYWFGGTYGDYNRWLTGKESYPRVDYPQSLGELCIEMAQDKYLRWQMDIEYGLIWIQSNDPTRDNGLRNPDQIYGFGTETRRDIQELRRSLYHKHKGRHERFVEETNLKLWSIYYSDCLQRQGFIEEIERAEKLIRMVKSAHSPRQGRCSPKATGTSKGYTK